MIPIPDYDAGTASVRIRPNMDRFETDLKSELEKVRTRARVLVEADTEPAARDLDRFRAEQEARPVNVRMETDRSGFDQVKKDIGDLGESLGSALKLNLGAAGIGELPALATVLATVTDSVQQLSGAGLAIPGVFAGIGVSAGTAALGVEPVVKAFKALDKASDGSKASVKAANDALAALAPNARDAVTAVQSLQPAFKDLQQVDESNLFAGMSDSIKTLAASDLPILKTGVDGISKALNQDLRQALTSLGTKSSQGFLDRILGNTGNADSRVKAAIDPLVHAFGTLTAAGSDTLPRLADAIGAISDRFDQFISVANSDGQLSKWINDGLTGFTHLGDAVLNVGKILGDIDTAAGGGGGLLSILDSATGKLNAFLSSTQGQNDLKNFFQDGRDEIEQLTTILENLGPIFTEAFDAARDATGVWLPVIKEATDVLAQDPGLVHAIADAFLAWKFVGVIDDVSTAVKGIATALGLVGPAASAAGTAGAAGLAPLEAAIAPIAAAIAALAGGTVLGSDALQTFAKEHPEDSTTAVYGPGGARRRGSQGAFGVKPDLPGGPVNSGSTAPHDLPGPAIDPTHGLLLPPGLFPPGHSSGGVLPGYSPGKDNMLVPLAGGEGIIRPEVVRKIGPNAIHALNRGFADGGVVPDFAKIATGGAPGGVLPGPVTGIPDVSGVVGKVSELIPGSAGSGKGKGGWSDQPMQDLLSGNPFAHAPDKLQPFSIGAAFGQLLLGGIAGFLGVSSSNPYTDAIEKTLGFYTGGGKDDGGTTSGSRGGQSKAASDKNIRGSQEKITRADQRVAEVEQRIEELKPDAKQSERTSLQNALTNAKQDAADARTDAAGLGDYAGGAYSSSGLPAAPTSGTGCSRWAPIVQQALQQVGPKYGITNIPAWTNALLGQIQFESGGNPAALNPKDSDGLPAIGLGQFKQGTFNAHNITGGSINDGVAQVYAMIDYVSSRYGQDSNGVPRGINQGHGYDLGGLLPLGASINVNTSGKPERVLTERQNVAFESMVKQAGVSPTPNFLQGPAAETMNPRPSVPARHLPDMVKPPPSQPAPPAPAAPSAAAGSGPAPAQGVSAAPSIGAAPSGGSHTNPALSKGITAGFQTAGNLAAAAASFGGAGGAGGLIQGLATVGGKGLNDVADVFSAFGVGSINQLGSTDKAYGYTAHPTQQQPDTYRPGGYGTYVGGIYGHNTDDVMRQLQDKESATVQGFYANL